MSLVAALLVGSSAFAIENVKVSGDAKLYYSTTENNGNSAFSKEASAGQAAVSLSLGADLGAGVSTGVKATALSTLGLEGQLVNNVWEATNGTADSYIVNEAWLATTLGKTTAKIGRMELDTPLVFSEKWSIVANSFEAAVVINQDIPDTVLVGAYVGGTNSQAVNNGPLSAPVAKAGGGIGGVIQKTSNETTFDQFYSGAYAIAAINNSFKPLVVQAWYFQATTNEKVSATNTLRGVKASWIQADLNMDGILAGVQYSGLTLDTDAAKIDTSALAVMVGYAMKDTVTAKLSYSVIAKDHSAGFNLAGTGQSKLYTEAWLNYGHITAADMSTVNLTVEAPAVAGMADLGLYVTAADQGNTKAKYTEIAITAGTTMGPLDAELAVIYAEVDDTAGATDKSETIQARLAYNF